MIDIIYISGTCNFCGAFSDYLAKNRGRSCPGCSSKIKQKSRFGNNGFKFSVYKRDGLRCQICGTIKSLCIHHILYRQFYPKLKNNTNNGIVLCQLHESQTHGYELELK